VISSCDQLEAQPDANCVPKDYHPRSVPDKSDF
jgi:hypothetical protein